MHEILNFAGALNPNAAYTRFRNTTASDWDNLRVIDQGFLEPRKGHTLVYDAEPISHVFAYRNLLFAVIGRNLKWARARATGIEVEFNDFDPALEVNSSEHYFFSPLQNENGEWILFANGDTKHVIDLDRVFISSNAQDPTVNDFYLPTANDPALSIVDDGPDDDHLENRPIAFVVQPVQVNDDDVKIAVGRPSSDVLLLGINTLKPESTAGDLHEDNRDAPHTRIRVTFDLPDSGAASEVDIYRAERNSAGLNASYYYIGRADYEDGGTWEYNVPITDDTLDSGEPLLRDEGNIDWRFLVTDYVRSYATDPHTTNLYLSYFDGINERLYRNFTDFIPLNLRGEMITGLKFLSDTNWLIVYTPTRIIVVLTDPNPELMRVIGNFGYDARDSSIGCAAPNTLVEIGQYHYFLAGNKQVYRFGGRRPTWQSDKVETILKRIEIREHDDARFEPTNAYAAAHERLYHLSLPLEYREPIHFIGWRNGANLRWRDESLQWRDESYAPNSTLILDTERDLWYQDSVGVSGYAKDQRDTLYGVIGRTLYSLYNNDESNEHIEWRWKSNMLLMPVHQLIHNVNVKTQGAADLDVIVTTEEGTQSIRLQPENANDYWGQRAGCNLRGRTLEVTIQGVGKALIDRISINERPRRSNLR